MTDNSSPPEDRVLFDALSALPPLQPPAGLPGAFHARLHASSQPERSPRRPWLIGIAATLIVAVSAGWWREHQARLTETSNLQLEFATALRNVSTSARLEAIAVAVREKHGGDDIEQALIAALLTDPNTSVRIAAAEALGRIARTEALAPALRRALSSEASPFVQLALLQATDRLSASERRGTVQGLLVREDLDDAVMRDAQGRLSTTMMGDSQ